MKFQRIFIGGLIAILLTIGLACQSSSTETVNNADQSPTPVEKLDDFAQRLKAVQDVNFDYI